MDEQHQGLGQIMGLEANLLIFALSFATATIDIVFGMGFGLTMTPLLIFLGYSPHIIVPALLLSSLVGNLLGSYFNHRLKNVDFTPGGKYFKIVIVIGAVGVIGSILGAMSATGISDQLLGTYIGFLVTGSGLFIVLNKKLKTGFSWFKLSLLSLFGSFNKGISGSGFGPVLTTGILFMGIEERPAVSIQGFSELFISLVGFSTFLLSGAEIDWSLTLSLSAGVAVSAPLAALIVSRVDSKKLRGAIGVATTLLGLITLMSIIL